MWKNMLVPVQIRGKQRGRVNIICKKNVIFVDINPDYGEVVMAGLLEISVDYLDKMKMVTKERHKI